MSVDVKHHPTHLVLIIVVIVFALVLYRPVHGLNPAGQSSSKAPYLYYYSHTLNAFVIERADGSDSRTLGAGIMTDDYWITTRALWSPSHRWFAWTAGQFCCGGEAFYDRGTWLIGADGKQRVRAVEGIDIVSEMLWSPTADLLLIGARGVIYVVDADAQKIITKYPTNVNEADSIYGTSLDLRWLPDGRHATFDYFSVSPDGTTTTYYEGELEAGGEVTVHSLGASSDNQGEAACNHPDFVPWRSGEWVASTDPTRHQLTLKNDQTGDHFTFTSRQIIDDVEWRSDARYAFVSTRQSCDKESDGDQILLANIDEHRVDPLPGVHWPVIESFAYSPLMAQWSPDNKWALIRAGTWVYVLLDPATRQIRPVLDLGKDVVSDYEPDTAEWTTDSQEILIHLHGSVYRYSLSAGLVTAMQVNTLYTQSANQRYVAYKPLGAESEVVHTENRVTGQIHRLMPYSGSYRYGEWVVWHPTDPWLIVVSGTTLAGGGRFYPMYTVSNLDGSVEREIERQTFIDWMPFDPPPDPNAHPTSVIGQPERVLFGHTDSVTALAWNPDNRRLASSGQDGTIRIWDTLTGRQIQVIAWNLEDSARFAYSAGNKPSPTALAWSSDGSRLISATDGYDIELWQVGKDVALAHCYGAANGRWAFDWVADGTVRVANIAPTQTSIGDMQHCQQIQSTGIGLNYEGSAAFVHNKNLLAIAPQSIQSLLLIDTRTGSSTETPNVGPVGRFSPDGSKYAAVGGVIWNVATQRGLTSLNAAYYPLGWSADGERLVTTSNSNDLHRYLLFDVTTGKQLLTFSQTALQDGVLSVFALSPGGNWLVGVGQGDNSPLDGDFRLWSASTGKLVARYTSGGAAVVWSPDGTRIATATSFAMQIWSLPNTNPF